MRASDGTATAAKPKKVKPGDLPQHWEKRGGRVQLKSGFEPPKPPTPESEPRPTHPSTYSIDPDGNGSWIPCECTECVLFRFESRLSLTCRDNQYAAIDHALGGMEAIVAAVRICAEASGSKYSYGDYCAYLEAWRREQKRRENDQLRADRVATERYDRNDQTTFEEFADAAYAQGVTRDDELSLDADEIENIRFVAKSLLGIENDISPANGRKMSPHDLWALTDAADAYLTTWERMTGEKAEKF